MNVSEIQGDNRLVIVRSRDAGCLYGNLVSYRSDGSIVRLANARQMWRWHAAEGGTLIDCASVGVLPGESKFSAKSADMEIIGACAIIAVTPEAAATLEAVKW